MMRRQLITPTTIESSLRAAFSEGVSLFPEGKDRFRVFTPFVLEDGDHLSIVLRRQKNGWLLTDEGHTFMHLSYFMDEKEFRHGTRETIIANTLKKFQIEDKAGQLVLPIKGEAFGNALYSYVQGLLKINNITFLSRERVRSIFMEEAKGTRGCGTNLKGSRDH